MTLDYQALLFNPIYDELGVEATLITTGNDEYVVTALDKTQAASFSSGNAIEFQAFRPMAILRMAEMIANNLSVVDDIQDGELTMNGKTWSIKSYEYIAAPTGINEGELRLILKDDVNV